MTFIENSFNRETIESIKREGVAVVIFGAGIVGEALFHACRNMGIKVECFCDNNINKTQSSRCNIEVIHALDLKAKYNDAVFLISAADIKDVIDQLHALGYSKWHASGLLLRDFNVSQCQFSAPMDFVEYAIATCLLCHDSYLIPDKLFLRSVDVIITERCSLKCRDCSNLMQYYKTPRDSNVNEVIRAIEVFCAIIDEVNEFRVIGGEPFMNKECHLIIKRLTDEPKARKVVIYTNGTIVPTKDQLECLKNEKVLFIITDYGKHSKRLSVLTEILLQNKIAFYAEKARGWTDCAKIMKHNRDIEQQKDIFRRCCAKNTITLSKGKLFRCPFSANADRLRAIPDNENDCISIIQGKQESADSQDVKMKIRAFLLKKDLLQACDYCNGRPFGAPEITPAIQTSKPLEYTQYDTQY